MLKLNDWLCTMCDFTEEALTCENETPHHCDLPMKKKMSWAYRGDVSMAPEYKRRELKGQRVKDIENRQIASEKTHVKPWQ